MKKYFSVIRPIGPGTIPNSPRVKNVINFDKKKYCPEIKREAWGYIEYDGVLKNCNDYDLVEELVKFRRDIEPGDSIQCNGTSAVVAKVISQDTYNCDYNIENSYCDCEFFDTDNQYRSWKSNIDGGKLTYYDEDNLYDRIDSPVLKNLLEECYNVLSNFNMFGDNSIVYLKKKNQSNEIYYLYRNFKSYGYVDLSKSDKNKIDFVFIKALKILNEIFGDVCFVAFLNGNNSTKYFIKNTVPFSYTKYICYLAKEDLKGRISCVGIDNKSYLKAVAGSWLRNAEVLQDTLDELNDIYHDNGEIWKGDYIKDKELYLIKVKVGDSHYSYEIKE